MTYNITQFRVLWEIASDGLRYQNIKSSSAQVAGDYSVLNLKSDIVEQVWRTSAIEDAFFQIDCGEPEDITKTQQKSVIFDTIAFLNHNMTSSAVIKIYGYGLTPDTSAPSSRSVFYSAGTLVATLSPIVDPLEDNLIYVFPTQPTRSYRHYLIEIKDPKNLDGYIEIGRFLAGEATIMTVEENMTSDFTYQEVNYKDELKLNGFSSISNVRSFKKKLTVSFKSLDAINYLNYKNLRRYFRYTRDSLKALVIPDPRTPYLFSLYARLSESPKQSIRSVDNNHIYVDLDVEWDEAK